MPLPETPAPTDQMIYVEPPDEAVLAERERCSGILRTYIQYARVVGADKDFCIAMMQGALRGFEPSEGKQSASLVEEERERCAKIAEGLIARG